MTKKLLVKGLSFIHGGALVLPIMPTYGTICVTGGLCDCVYAVITKVKNVKK